MIKIYIKKLTAECWWLRPVILATQEAEIRRILIQDTVQRLYLKKTHPKKRVTQGVGPEFKPQ
jgi:hypothetical protein